MKSVNWVRPVFRTPRALVCGIVLTIAVTAPAGTPGQSYIEACDNDSSPPEKQGEDCLYLGKIYSPTSVEGKAAHKKGCELYEKACKSDVYHCLKYADSIEKHKVEAPPSKPEKIRSDTKASFEKLCDKKNDAVACHLRALLFEQGLWGSATDEKKAAALYSKACKNGDPKLKGYIDHKYANRRPCGAEKKLLKKFVEERKKERFFKPLSEIEKVKKVSDLEKLCGKGEPEACNAAADMYAGGKGAKKSKSKAKEYRTKALTIWKEACDWYGMTYQTRSNGYECVRAGYAYKSAEIKNNNLYADYLKEGVSRMKSACANLNKHDLCYWTAVQEKLGEGTYTGQQIHHSAHDRFKLACSNSKDKWIKAKACHQVKLYKTSPSGTPYDPSTEKSKDGKWKKGDAAKLMKKGDQCEKSCAADVLKCAEKSNSKEPNINNRVRMECYGPGSGVWGKDNKSWTLKTCISKCRKCIGDSKVSVWQGRTCSVCPYGYSYDSDALYCYAGTNAERKKFCDIETREDYQSCMEDAREISISEWRKLAIAACVHQKKDDDKYCRDVVADFKRLMKSAKTGKLTGIKHSNACCNDDTDNTGKNMLHMAAGAGHLDVVKYLVREADKSDRIEVFAKDKKGLTAVDYAEKGKHTEVVTYLRSKDGKSGREYSPVFPLGAKNTIPTISKLTPPGGGAGVTIVATGTNLNNKQAVYTLGKIKLKPTNVQSKKLTFVIPKNAKTAPITVKVGKWTQDISKALPIYKVPKVTSAKPKFAVPGETVTIKGANLEIISGLKLSGKKTKIASKSSKEISFKVSSGAKTGELIVTGPGGEAKLKKEYEIFYAPKLSKANRASGRADSKVMLAGKNLDTPKVVFKLGKTKLKVINASETKVTVVIPAKAKTGKFSVTARKKTSELTAPFIVHFAPKLTAATPNSGAPGDTVTLKGKNLDIITMLEIGSKTIKMVSKTKTKIVFKVPSKTKTGAITVSGPGGEATLKKEFRVK
ncbi:MAG: hypothetical protein GY854_23465 [Deltaproteobacteria bacterium]|nr:hypothetical protein [Deltaproteobacteria bacterium]